MTYEQLNMTRGNAAILHCFIRSKLIYVKQQKKKSMYSGTQNVM